MTQGKGSCTEHLFHMWAVERSKLSALTEACPCPVTCIDESQISRHDSRQIQAKKSRKFFLELYEYQVA